MNIDTADKGYQGLTPVQRVKRDFAHITHQQQILGLSLFRLINPPTPEERERTREAINHWESLRFRSIIQHGAVDEFIERLTSQREQLMRKVEKVDERIAELAAHRTAAPTA